MIDYTAHYVYQVEFPSAPAFQENLQTLWTHIFSDNGKSPSVKPTYNENGDFLEYIILPQIGTVITSVKELVMFELPMRMDEAELLAYMDEGMSNPKPPMKVTSIESKFEILPVEVTSIESKFEILPVKVDEESVGYVCEVIVQIQRTDVMQFIRIPTYDEDGNSTGSRPANNSDELNFSRYSGSRQITIDAE